MEVGAMPRRTMEGRLFVGRRKGRPRLRWTDDIADLRAMKIKQWTEKAKDRGAAETGCQGDQGSPKAVAPGGWITHCILTLEFLLKHN
jgi:hypothetical protein